jgi:hypothetical protein
LPTDTSLLGGIDLKSLVESPLYERHKQQLDPRQLDAFSNRVGLDPRRDITQALLTWKDGQAVVLAHGRFDTLKHDNTVTFPKPDVLAFGPTAFLQHVPDNDTQLPPALRDQLAAIPKTDQIWIVSDHGLPLERVPASADARSALSNIANNIRAFSVGIGADAGAHLHAVLICDSDAGAKRVHDALRGMIGMGRLMTRDDQMGMLKLYDAVRVDQDQSIVRVHADLDAQEADAAITLASNFRRR